MGLGDCTGDKREACMMVGREGPEMWTWWGVAGHAGVPTLTLGHA